MQTIYRYKSASRFLIDRTLYLQKNQPQFSIRKWAKEMGFPSHSLLTMILQGKRNLTLRQAPLLAKGLKLSTPEMMFFQGLIQIENAKTIEEKRWCELYLAELRPEKSQLTSVRELDEYLSISDWIHPALLALSDTQGSFLDVDEAKKRLSTQHSLIELRAAIERLLEMGLLTKDELGKFRATYHRITTSDETATKGVREYHRQCAALVAKKIETQNRHERELQSLAIAIPSSKLSLAKELIRKFRTQFSQAMDSPFADEVYQLNIHFLRLTECPSVEFSQKENEGADLSKTKTEYNHV